MNKLVIVVIFVCVTSCSSESELDQETVTQEPVVQEPVSEMGAKIFSRAFYSTPELGDGALFSSTDVPAVPEFINARVAYNFFETEYADDLTYWAVSIPSSATVTLVPDIETPFGRKAVSHVLMENASRVRLIKSHNAFDIPLVDLLDRDFEYSIWFYNNNAIPSRVFIELLNRPPINGSTATLCTSPPKQWVRCSGRLHTGSVLANNSG